MEDNKPVPYAAHSAMLARMERMNSRCFIVIIILIILLFATNGAWLYYESQWEYMSTSVTQENDSGFNNYIGNDGEIINGETDSNN